MWILGLKGLSRTRAVTARKCTKKRAVRRKLMFGQYKPITLNYKTSLSNSKSFTKATVLKLKTI